MVRPSMSRGRPAFGCAESGASTLCSIRSIVSSIGAGPDAAVHADDVGAARDERRARTSRAACRRACCRPPPSSSAPRWAGRTTAHRRDCRPDLVQVAEGLEHEEVDAALERAPRPARGSTLRPRRRRACPRARCGSRAGRWRRPRTPDRAPPGAAIRAPATLMSCSCSARPKAASFSRLAPKVLVSSTSAPARTYSRCTPATRSGSRRFSASNTG